MAFSREAQTNYTDCQGSRTHWSCGLTSGGSAAHPQLSLCRAKDTAAPAHTRPQELIRLKNNLSKSSKANQTFCGQVSILSTAAWFSVQSQTHARQGKEGTAGSGAKVLLKTGPKLPSFPNEAHQEKNRTEQVQRCSCSSAPGAVLAPRPSPAQAAPAANLAAVDHSWEMKQKEAPRPQFRAA